MGTNERRERERKQRRRKILEAAREVFLARSIEAATMDEVAERAELSKGALYLYFASKDDLVTGLLLSPLEELVDAFGAELDAERAGAERLGRMLRLQIDSMRRHRPIFQLVYGSRCAHAGQAASGAGSATQMQQSRERLLALYADAIERGQRDGTIRNNVEPSVVAVQMWASLIGLGVLSVRDHALGLPVDDVAASLVDLFGWALQPAAPAATAAPALPRGARSRRSA